MTRPRTNLQTITLRKPVNRLCEGEGNSGRSYISFVIILQKSVAFFCLAQRTTREQVRKFSWRSDKATEVGDALNELQLQGIQGHGKHKRNLQRKAQGKDALSRDRIGVPKVTL